MDKESFDRAVNRIHSHRGILHLLVSNENGDHTFHSTMGREETKDFLGKMKLLEEIANALVRNTDPSNRLFALRISSVKHEILLYPGADQKVIVMQDANVEEN